uniref:Ground-like domain-containing protein n=1 Tax=Meloidogyne hapla TaxID=6305 RepID=A0A1I8C3G3_MELHA
MIINMKQKLLHQQQNLLKVKGNRLGKSSKQVHLEEAETSAPEAPASASYNAGEASAEQTAPAEQPAAEEHAASEEAAPSYNNNAVAAPAPSAAESPAAPEPAPAPSYNAASESAAPAAAPAPSYSGGGSDTAAATAPAAPEPAAPEAPAAPEPAAASSFNAAAESSPAAAPAPSYGGGSEASAPAPSTSEGAAPAAAAPAPSYGAQQPAPSVPEAEVQKGGYFRRRSRQNYDNAQFAAKTVTVDSKCNNEELRKIMDKSIAESTATSKRAIAKNAREHFGSSFDVVCSTADFSYLANTRIFCEHKVTDITCFAFEH